MSGLGEHTAVPVTMHTLLVPLAMASAVLGKPDVLGLIELKRLYVSERQIGKFFVLAIAHLR